MYVYTLSQIIWMISYEWYAGDLACRVVKFFHTFGNLPPINSSLGITVLYKHFSGFYLNSFVVACFAIDRVMGTRNLR